MEINNKFTKIFFIFLFFIFIFLFLNSNPCYGFETQSFYYDGKTICTPFSISSNDYYLIKKPNDNLGEGDLCFYVFNSDVYYYCLHGYGRGIISISNYISFDVYTLFFEDGKDYYSSNDYIHTSMYPRSSDNGICSWEEIFYTSHDFGSSKSLNSNSLFELYPVPTPSVPEEEKFKIHLKDLNCGIWRNFTIQYPNYSNEKYLIYLDTFRRDYSNCTNEVEAVFKLIVFNDDSFISVEDFDKQFIVLPYYRSTNEEQKYVARFCNNETNNLFLFNKEDKNIYIPFNALTYNVFESTLSYCSTSSNYSITQFEYVESVSQDYFKHDYDSIYGNKICSNSFFIGSNCNIISVYENTEVDVITKFVSREILDRIFYTIALGNNYRYSIAYDFDKVYNRNSSCYGSNYAFQNEFWSNYRDNHKHIVEIDGEGNKVVIPETNYVDSGFVVSGSDNYIKDSNSNNLFDQNEDVIEFVPVVQTPTNTDTFLVETEEGEKVENTGDISSTDTDVIEKDNNKNDTSSWGVIDFLKGLFSSLGDLFTFLKQALLGILDFISNIGKTILSLFIPDSDFWGSFSSDMNSYLNEHLGLIFQPFEILGNILERYNNIEFVEPRLVIPEIKVPLTDYVLMESKEVNFSSVLEIEIIGYLHNIYLCCVDVYLLFLVLNRIRQLGEEVFNK